MTKYEWESELKKNIHRLPDDEIKRVLEYYDELFADKIERGLGEFEIVAQFGNPVDVADKILSEYDGELRPVQPPVTPSPQPQPSLRPPQPQQSRPQQTAPQPPQQAPSDEYSCRYHSNGKLKNAHRLKNARAGGSQRRSSEGGSARQGCGFQADRFALFLVLNFITGFTFFILVGVAWIVAAAFAAAGGAMVIGGAAGTAVSIVQAFGIGAAGAAQVGGCLAVCGLGVLMLVGSILLIKLMAKLTVKLFAAIRGWICPQKAEATEEAAV